MMLPAKLILLILIVRVWNACMLQSQFDPDEYWQTLEPAYCEVFPERGCAYTWEWLRRSNATSVLQSALEGPIRSYTSILPTYLLYKAAQALSLDTPWVISKGPQILNAIFCAMPTDLSVWILSAEVDPDIAGWALFISLTSWFQAYALVRTYTNSLETMLLSIGMTLVSREWLGGKVIPSTPRRIPRASIAFFLGGLSLAARFSGISAWVPLGIMLAFSNNRTIGESLMYLFCPCALFGLLGLTLSIIVDRIFYGFWTLPLLGNLHFNVLQGLGKLYGTHPWHWYLTAGLPATIGLCILLVLPSLARLRSSKREQSMWCIILSFVSLHSVSGHKEFRFLLPILPLTFSLSAKTLVLWLKSRPTSPMSTRILIAMSFVIPNLMVFLFLAQLHQSAPIRINQAIRDRHNQPQNKVSSFKVHYLMGCHSAPLYSHLHVQGSARFQAWHLDCSPSCRLRNSCESDLFLSDPEAFIKNSYVGFGDDERCSERDSGADQGECSSLSKHGFPDYIVINEVEARRAETVLARMNMKEKARFMQSINGARLIGYIQLGEEFTLSRQATILPFVELSFEDIVLFEREPSEASTGHLAANQGKM